MWFFKNKSYSKVGMIQALGVVGYVILFATVVINGSKFFPHIKEAYAPVMVLTLLSFSVLTCGLLVFYRPYLLFLDKKPREAIDLVVQTTKWLGIFAVVIVATVMLLSR